MERKREGMTDGIDDNGGKGRKLSAYEDVYVCGDTSCHFRAKIWVELGTKIIDNSLPDICWHMLAFEDSLPDMFWHYLGLFYWICFGIIDDTLPDMFWHY